jgi:sister chromatid cohesion protein DCC1
MIILPTPKLAPLLSILLTLLTIHSSIQLNKPTGNTPTAPIMKALEEDHDVPASLGTAVLTLFGKLEGGIWEADTSGMVREIGKGMLESVQAGKSSEEFLNEWKAAVGESWEELVDISLLEVRPQSQNPTPHRSAVQQFLIWANEHVGQLPPR